MNDRTLLMRIGAWVAGSLLLVDLDYISHWFFYLAAAQEAARAAQAHDLTEDGWIQIHREKSHVGRCQEREQDHAAGERLQSPSAYVRSRRQQYESRHRKTARYRQLESEAAVKV